ncbi:MAG: GNAT family N-acetyltransferase [Planctomycetaceae bacterium]|nr:GNAT family N-acetyltransferase [Planctomycetaceae bacterium]
MTMIDYRPFRNTDPPALCEIWRSQPPLRLMFQPLTPAVLERVVLSKPFFDRRGLIVATDQGRPIGFAHAGFGADRCGTALDQTFGATCMLMVMPHAQRTAVIERLLELSEAYLRASGATTIFGGGSPCVAPFYHGLYGGCRVPGVLESDRQTVELYQRRGYRETARQLILQRPVVGFRPPMDRQQIQLRRALIVEPAADPPPSTWWEACTESQTDRYAYQARPRTGGDAVATAVYWDMEPLASSWGVHARGLMRLDVPTDSEFDREVLAILLLGETLRLLQLDGVTLVETHVAADDAPRCQLFSKLGFQCIEQALELRSDTC